MNISFESVINRILMILSWGSLIAGFLYLPYVYRLFDQKATLTIFTPPLLLDPEYIKKFEEKKGVRVTLSYFENGSALLSKIAATGGKGYDLVLPDDHTLDVLISRNMLKPLDKNKLAFWSQLHTSLLNPYYDPHNRFTVPYYWGVYGIAYDADQFPEGFVTHTWELIFSTTPCPGAHICMTDDPREAILIAAQYLFGTIDALKDPVAQEAVKQLLIRQKKQVEVYTLARADTLLQTKSCSLATIASPEAWRVSRLSPEIKMIIPQEGSFFIIDSFGILKDSEKDELIYEFLNFIFEQESIKHHSQLYGFCSPLTTIFVPSQNEFCPIDQKSNFDFFRPVISDEHINEIWTEVIAA